MNPSDEQTIVEPVDTGDETVTDAAPTVFAWIERLTHIGFLLFFTLMLLVITDPSRFVDSLLSALTGDISPTALVFQQPLATPLALLAGAVVIGWSVTRLARQSANRWTWGPAWLTLSIAGLTLLYASGFLRQPIPANTDAAMLRLALFWFLYLFIVNERPDFLLPVAVLTSVQGAVATAQFALQRNVGLGILGEPTLDPAQSGVIVMWVAGERIMRAYGLTRHPNLLGDMLTIFLLLLLPILPHLAGWRRIAAITGCVLALLGVALSFSRGAYLALGFAGLAWGVWWVCQPGWRQDITRLWSSTRARIALVFGLLLLAVLLYGARDIVLSRLLPSARGELVSINERVFAANLALDLIRDHPWRGVGDLFATMREVAPGYLPVHTIGLFVTAEQGVTGGLLWLWYMAAPFLMTGSMKRWASSARTDLPYTIRMWQIGPWTALIVMGLFHLHMWITVTSRLSPIMYGLLTANLVFPIMLTSIHRRKYP